MSASSNYSEAIMDCSTNLGVIGKVHSNDFIFHYLLNNTYFKNSNEAVSYYFHDGRKSANKLLQLLNSLGSRFQGPLSMLEFASGYGCVTRHLPLVLPEIDTVACDIHEEAIEFISSDLNQSAILSCNNPEDFNLNQKYDVIFSLSFFSHMPQKTWGRWIAAHYRHLKPGGALIFTTHGLASKIHIGDIDIPSNGFWFKPESEQGDLEKNDYGTTLVTKNFVQQEISNQIGRPIEQHHPAFWWEHQDLYIVLEGKNT